MANENAIFRETELIWTQCTLAGHTEGESLHVRHLVLGQATLSLLSPEPIMHSAPTNKAVFVFPLTPKKSGYHRRPRLKRLIE